MIVFKRNEEIVKECNNRREAKQFAEECIQKKLQPILVYTGKEVFNVDCSRSREYFGIKWRPGMG